ncbi:hypothetical protein [Hyalangium rubrum]|uniref:Uncharacterized protein n=1 Tax=Hyalangium rubrum TaxID=3103134 RepID=A0ABU5HA83_9BACT|nr:hypothetical protein [Hyalangium sp. s54d21]MDY7230216.1 hypothetical protein [Hyalangium sp. s54d21]
MTSAPTAPPQRPVLLLDYLLRIRKDTLAGRLAMHIGEPNIEHMVGFVNGYHSCMLSNGIEDEEYGRFFDWLMAKGEFPGEGWAAKYLRDCHGDHEQAIRKYLDFVAEFIALHRK